MMVSHDDWATFPLIRVRHSVTNASTHNKHPNLDDAVSTTERPVSYARLPTMPHLLAAIGWLLVSACISLSTHAEPVVGASGITVTGLLHPSVPESASLSPSSPSGERRSNATTQRSLRVVRLRAHDANHPHRDSQIEFDWISRFAKTRGAQVVVTEVSRPRDLIPNLTEQDFDLILSDLPIDAVQSPEVLASESFHQLKYQIVARSHEEISSPLDLANHRIALSVSSPAWSYFEALAAQRDDIYLAALPEYLSQTQALDKVARGEYDVTVIQVNDAEQSTVLDPYPNLTAQFDLTPQVPVAFYAQRRDTDLIDEINGQLRRDPLYPSSRLARKGDLERIEKRRVLRVITSPANQRFYFKNGRPSGFEYVITRNFAANLGLEVEFVVAESERQMLEWLDAGIGDMISAPLSTATPGSAFALAHSKTYHYSPAVVVGSDHQTFAEIEDLNGLLIGAEFGSMPWAALELLRAQAPWIKFEIVALPSTNGLATLTDAVAASHLDAVVVDGAKLAVLEQDDTHLTPSLSLPTTPLFRWTVRQDDHDLLAAADRYLARAYERGTYANASRRFLSTLDSKLSSSLTPYDDLLKIYAERYELDWRLLAAVMYQESQFDRHAVSPDGALGLMQMMPATGDLLGVDDLFDPAQSIRAGAKYLAGIRDSFDSSLPLRERTWFALAGYNAGPGRVERARRLAVELKLDPNVWFGNVEIAMSKIGLPPALQQLDTSRDCWCDEPVKYVRNISRFYDNYRTFSDLVAQRARAESLLAWREEVSPSFRSSL